MTWSTAAETTPPAVREEPVLRPLHPRVRVLWWCSGVLALLQALVPVAILDFAVPHPLADGRITSAVAVAGLVLVAVVPVVRYRRWRYALRAEDLWVRQGVLTVTVTVVPYRRLQFVDTRQGPLERLFGLSQLVVHTAAVGTSARVPGLEVAEAERLRESLATLEPDDPAI
jgi:membrane protein YdbS with pleckstrin-like domain